MTKEKVIEQLRERTKADPILDAAMHVLALRKRPRHNLTLDGLYYRMKREGFNHPKKEYARVFKLFSELGLARVLTDIKGEPLQAKDFRLPIPLIGAAACGTDVPFSKMGKPIGQAPSSKEPIRLKSYRAPGSHLTLTVLVNNKAVNIPVPNTLTRDELSSLIVELWDLSEGLDKKYG